MQAVANRSGWRKRNFWSRGAATVARLSSWSPQPVRRSISPPNNRWLLKDAGKAEMTYPWTSYEAGGTAQLNGAYYCRIRLNGKEATFSKKSVENTDRLVFPDP